MDIYHDREMNNKFLLNEIDNGQNSDQKILFSKRFIELRRRGIVSFHNYFADSGCGFAVMELRDWYYVELITNKIQSHLDILYRFVPEENVELYRKIIEKYDSLDIIKNFTSNTTVALKGEKYFLNKLIQINDESIYYGMNLIFSKEKFSKSECEYWSNISLKNWVKFYVLTLDAIYVTERKIYFNDEDYLTTKKRYVNLSKIYKLLREVDLNCMSFTIEALTEYCNFKMEVEKEIDFVLRTARDMD